DVPLADDEVDLAEVEQRWKGAVLWLDARPRDQFEKGHIPGAHLLNEQEFDELVLVNIDLLQGLTKPVVIYCSGQACKASHAVRDRLVNTGIIHENVFVLRGGFPAWEAAGGPVEKP
ncbi:MAG: rhodanese-like domain-containing protein, partial [Verrucomicrobiales bacterium]|nr:rhodanese-like domain-containing protein [Verrucomicrobiales bacterium]